MFVKKSIDGKTKSGYDVSIVTSYLMLFIQTWIEKESCSMYTQEIVVNNEVGLHARPATFFIQKANEFKSSIWVEKDERRVNAKSLLGVLSLGIVKGTAINLIADGPDEEAAINALVELINSEFSE